MLNNLVLNTGKIVTFEFISNRATDNISLYSSGSSSSNLNTLAILGTLTFNLKSNTNPVWLNGSFGYDLQISQGYSSTNSIGPLYIAITKNGVTLDDIIYDMPIQYFLGSSLPTTIPAEGISINQYGNFDWIDTTINNTCNSKVTYNLIIYIPSIIDVNVSYNLTKNISPITFKAMEIQQ